MTRRLILVLLIITLLGVGLVHAQTSSGQICIRAFEDRNANGQDDTSEPRIQRLLSATLADSNGVILASEFMENSVNASAGVLCFQRLAAGQYTLRVVSAEHTFTTETEFFTAITDTGIQTFPVGGQLIVSTAPAIDTSGEFQPERLVRPVIFAGIGAAIVIGAMTIVGAVIYLLFMRRAAPAKYATGAYPAVRTDTGSYQAVRTDTGSYPAVQNPTTGSMRPVIMPQTDSTDVPMSPKTPPSVPRVQYEDDDTNRPLRPTDSVDDDFQFTDDE